LQTFESRLAESEEKWKTAENNLNECKASWEEQKRLHEEEMGKLTSRCEELTSQNALLHEQGEKVATVYLFLRKFCNFSEQDKSKHKLMKM
jgi:hypothetical protein